VVETLPAFRLKEAGGNAPWRPHRTVPHAALPRRRGVVAAWEAFQTTWEVLDAVLVGYGAWELGRKIGARLRRGRKVMDKHLPDWRLRGAMTHSFIRLLREQPWHPWPLAQLLYCSQEEAAAVLELYGFVRRGNGLYYPGREGAEAFLWTIHQRIQDSYADSSPAPDALHALLEANTAGFLQSNGDTSLLHEHSISPLPRATSPHQ
jgi:hypothetical protein